jgi:hypothetical protein
MQRLNFTLDDATVQLLDSLADQRFGGNKSQTVRAALEALAGRMGADGWVVTGYTMVELERAGECHHCGSKRAKGTLMYRPVFERGAGPAAIKALPAKVWLDCPDCVASGDGCVHG